MASCIACGSPSRTLFNKGEYGYARCARCGLVSSDPIPSEGAILDHYDRKFASGNYELIQRFNKEYSNVYRQFVDVLRQRIDLGSKPRVLDIGCFTGNLLTLMQEAGADVYGLELQPQAVEIASRALPGRIFRADVHGTAFPQGPFDVITATGLIEHVTDPIGLVDRIHELLKPGGILLLQTPDSGSLLARFLGRLWPPYAPVEHIHLFSSRSLVRLLEPRFVDIRTAAHWKPLPIEYVYEMLQHFGPELRKLLNPIYGLLPRSIRQKSLRFYIGEMILTARRRPQI